MATARTSLWPAVTAVVRLPTLMERGIAITIYPGRTTPSGWVVGRAGRRAASRDAGTSRSIAPASRGACWSGRRRCPLSAENSLNSHA